jgi:hypothetical protein
MILYDFEYTFLYKLQIKNLINIKCSNNYKYINDFSDYDVKTYY